MTHTDRLCLHRVRQNILAIAEQYGLGYPEAMYRRIVAIEMNHNDLSCQANVEIPVRFDSKVMTQHPSDHLLVEGSYLLGIRSLLDHPPRYDFARTKTYLNSLGLKFGLVVNFGKKQLQIFGVNPDQP
jgi:GxxExxY protein